MLTCPSVGARAGPRQARLPREAKARPLRARKDHICVGGRSGSGWRQAHLDVLVSHELHTGTPVRSPAPVVRSRNGAGPTWSGCEPHTHEGSALRSHCPDHSPLLAQRTRATTANAGRIDHAQTSIGFSTPLLGVKRLSCWTPERSIGLERKVLPREATRLPRRVAVVGGPYPEAGADEAGRVAFCPLCSGRAGANSVVRTGSGCS